MKILLPISGMVLACILTFAIVPNLVVMHSVNAQLSPSSAGNSPSVSTSGAPSTASNSPSVSKSLSPSTLAPTSPQSTTPSTSPSTTTSTALTQQCIDAQKKYTDAKIALNAAIKAYSAAPWDPVLKSKYIKAINDFNAAALALGFIPNCPTPQI